MTKGGAGKLRDRLTIEFVTARTVKGSGKPSPTYTPAFPLWAEQLSASGGETLRGTDGIKREAHVTHVFKVRETANSSQITPTNYRVDFGGVKLNIVRVTNFKSTHRYRLIQCTEVSQ